MTTRSMRVRATVRESLTKKPNAHPAELEPTSSEPTLEGAFSPEGIDLTLIRWMLELSPTERLRAAQEMIDTVSAFHRRAANDPP
jgi:hypothetical protein